jgi:mercuric ion binding protein
MIRHIAAASLVILLSPWAAQAAEKTVELNVNNATCELCAPIVKRSLSRVTGVKSVQVKEASANSSAVATVTFDDAVTNVAALVAATTKAGFPSQPAGQGG